MMYAVKPGAGSERLVEGLVRGNVSMTHFGFSRNSRRRRGNHVSVLGRLHRRRRTAATVLLSAGKPRVHANILGSKGGVGLRAKGAFALAARSVIKSRGGMSVACGKLTRSMDRKGVVLVSSNLVKLGMVKGASGRVRYRVVGNNRLKRGGNIGMPKMPMELPTVARGSGRSVGFKTRRKVSFVTTSFMEGTRYVLRVGTCLGSLKTPCVPVVTGVRGRRKVDGVSRVVHTTSNVVITHKSLKIRVPTRRLPCLRGVVVRGYGSRFGAIVATARVLSSVVHGPHPAETRMASITGTMCSKASTMVLSKRATRNGCPLRTLRVVIRVVRRARGRLSCSVVLRGRRNRLENKVSDTVKCSSMLTTTGLGTGYVVAPSMSKTASEIMSGLEPERRVLNMAPGREALEEVSVC